MLVRRSTCVGPLGGSNSRGIRGGGAAPGQQPRRYNRDTGGSRRKPISEVLAWFAGVVGSRPASEKRGRGRPANTTFPGKKGLVVDGSRAGGESSAVRPWGEAHEQPQIRASALNFTTARTRGKAPRGAHVGPSGDKAIHVRLTRIYRPVARQGRSGQRCGRRRRGRSLRQAEAFFISLI